MQPNVSALQQAQQGFQQMGQGVGQVGQAAGQGLGQLAQGAQQAVTPFPMGEAVQGANQLMQHPQVQQALQSVGQFLSRIGHPFATAFNAFHGFGGQQGISGQGLLPRAAAGLAGAAARGGIPQPNTSAVPTGNPVYTPPPARK